MLFFYCCDRQVNSSTATVSLGKNLIYIKCPKCDNAHSYKIHRNSILLPERHSDDILLKRTYKNLLIKYVNQNSDFRIVF